MAYVALSRSERLEDIYIKGDLDRTGIHASPRALGETARLQTLFDKKMENINFLMEKYWKISYVNISSLNCHKDDAKHDDFLMSSWSSIFLDLGANLAPTCPPSWSHFGSKFAPRALQNAIQIVS